MYEYYIYLIKNKINKKKYVGQTVDFNKRMKQHEYGRNDNRISVIDKAIRKYGIDNFDIKIIDTASTQIEVDEKERFYIKEYKCLVPNGYNILNGGRYMHGSWNSKKVYMYNLNGEFMEEFESASEIERKTNRFYLRENIRDCCNGKSKKCKDKIFLYKKYDSINPYKKIISSRRRKVYQFSKEGNLINEYNSITDASSKTRTSRTSISGCLSGYYKTANNYIWSYEKEIEKPRVSVKGISILQCNEDYEVIDEFLSCSEAERNLNLRKGAYKTIHSVLDKNKKRYGYYWLRKNKDNPVPSL